MEKYSSEFCYKCMNDFDEDEDVVYCPSCGRYYHEKCWVENGGCVGTDCECSSEKTSSGEAGKSFYTTEPLGSTDSGAYDGTIGGVGAVGASRIPSPEKVIARTDNISGAKKSFFAMFWTAIAFLITGLPFFIVGTITYEDWCFFAASGCFAVALICGLFAKLLYFKATEVVITTKRVMFISPLGKENTLPLDLVTGTAYSSWFGQFGVVSASVRCRVKFHANAKNYYTEINKALLDRQSNII